LRLWRHPHLGLGPHFSESQECCLLSFASRLIGLFAELIHERDPRCLRWDQCWDGLWLSLLFFVFVVLVGIEVLILVVIYILLDDGLFSGLDVEWVIFPLVRERILGTDIRMEVCPDLAKFLSG
jgi:hypothetical protein